MDDRHVFINCPFDNDFFPLLKALLFTVVYIDRKPKISETSDSGQTRLQKLIDLMKSSRYSIHDISRVELWGEDELPRFNMPFECGVDFGLKFSSSKDYINKRLLILDSQKYRYQKVLSDISGNDIKIHENDAEFLIKNVRDWFKTFDKNVPFYKEIWNSFNDFLFDYHMILEDEEMDPNDINALTFGDLIEYMETWIEIRDEQYN